MKRPVAVCALVLSAGVLALPGCGPTAKTQPDPEPPAKLPPFSKPANADQASAADRTELAKGNNTFALAFFDQVRTRETGNLFFSPASISVALAMTYGGAQGETATEMAKALRLPLPAERVHPAFAGLLWDWYGHGEPVRYQLHLANSLWGQKGYQFVPTFLDRTRDNYSAGLQRLDLAGQPEESRKAINDWVEENTGKKIVDFLPPKFITPVTRLVLVNAIYFKGDWASQFKKSATTPGPFHVKAGRQVEVPFMHQEASFRYGATADVQVLEMPYQGKDVSMLVVLPVRKDGLAAVEKNLTAEQLEQWVERLEARQVDLALPRFKMTSFLDLKETLEAMGMKLAFDADAADLHGIAPPQGADVNLYIGAAIHQAVIEVNEEGAEAAAATAIRIDAKDRADDRPRPVTFRADHPFLFVIRHNRTGSILFLGRVANPQG